MNIGKFRQLEVVDVYNGKLLGTVSDLVINLDEGKIESIIVSGIDKIVNIFNKEEILIDWEDIKKIGDDVIIVNHNRET